MARPLTAADVKEGRIIYLEIRDRFVGGIRFAGPFLPSEADVEANGLRTAGCVVDSIAAPTGYQLKLEPLTTHRAKKIAAQALTDYGFKFEKLTAQTVSFSDLARGESIFVTIKGLSDDFASYERPSHWAMVKDVVRKAGFCID